MKLLMGITWFFVIAQPFKGSHAVEDNGVIRVFEYRKSKKKEVKKKKRKPRARVNYKKKLDIALKENSSLKERLQKLKSSRLKLDFTTSINIPMGTTLRGVLLNNVISSNLTSPVIVKVAPTMYLKDGGELHCTGKRENRRVYVACNSLMVKGRQYSGLVTSLLNDDGTNGLKGDYWSGEERYVAGVMTSSLASGIILASQETTPTSLGNIPTNSGKNTIIGGLASSAEAANGILTEKLKKSQGVVTLRAGSEVLVYFNGGYTQ